MVGQRELPNFSSGRTSGSSLFARELRALLKTACAAAVCT